VGFQTGRGDLSWAEYQEALRGVKDSEWFEAAGQRALVEWQSEESARDILAPESYRPADWVRSLPVPLLGIFFEHDQSTPPGSAAALLDAARTGGVPDVTVRIFPGLDHGLWQVSSLSQDRDTITHRSPRPGRFAVDWLKGLFAPVQPTKG